MEILRREFIYIWYYFSIQLEQVFFYWVLGMVIGSAISVFGKGKIHSAFQALGKKNPGVLGLIPASLLGIASPLCMYGTIPIAASFSQKGMKDDMLAAFMMSSILLNPQLLITSGILGAEAVTVRFLKNLGMSIGSAAAFMITEPATKITNLGALKIVLGVKRFVLYLAYVILISLVIGLAVDRIL